MAMRYGFDASISANVLTSDPVEFPCLNVSEWPRDHKRACVSVCVYIHLHLVSCTYSGRRVSLYACTTQQVGSATHCTALQHTHSVPLLETPLEHTATHCNTPQHKTYCTATGSFLSHHLFCECISPQSE